eukprot:TRINITY_DN60563_c0_g1_i1.p1 TRINITY_DN60563_c0_g1~~TRINITY_DN60563_c0_g1_i1.p1  ORF type:complete len:569 (+),score=125.75 TRINITY_DN60563_c0_g1_i1:94-1707(+)
MGQKQAKQGDIKGELKQLRLRLARSHGDIQITGRYHLLPKRLKDDYEVSKTELGSGYNGAVHLGKSIATGEKVAVKPFKLFGLKAHQRRELRQEAEIFLSMDHPHVARLKDVYQEETNLFFVMECLDGGELFDRISQKKRFSEKDAADAAYQMLLAVNYLHTSKGIIHRDIKPENFLYDAKGSNHLKLIDFGFSKAHKPENKRLSFTCGTTNYMAPEVLTGSYDFKCDMWSFGVIMYILLLGSMPFKDSSEERLKEKIKACQFDMPAATSDENPGGISQTAHEFISKLMEPDVEKRMSAEEALQHPFLELRHRSDSEPCVHALDEATLKSLSAYGNSSKFKRHCLNLCAWSMTNEQRSEIRHLFLDIDSDKTGNITLPEFKEALKRSSLGRSMNAEQIFGAFSVDNNEVIDYSDFLAASLSTRIAGNEETIRAAFARFDVNADGVLTSKDMRAVLGSSFTNKEIDEIVKAMDTDGDGGVSLEEFGAYMAADEADEVHLRAASEVIEHELQLAHGAKEGSDTTKAEETKQKSSVCSIL